MTRRLRFVIFSGSIVSDFGNSVATTVRSLSEALIAQGHDVVHCEERRNRYLIDLLTHRGSEPLRAFNAAFPLLTYRQFDVLGGAARRVWFSREISTADAVIGFDGCEEGVLAEIQELRSERTLAFYPGSTHMDERQEALWYTPAVYPRVHANTRSGAMAVAYEHPVTSHVPTNRYAAGPLSLEDWAQVTEIELIGRYGTTERVRFASSDTEGWGLARAMLPVAAGAVAELEDGDGQVTSSLHHLDDRFNAAIRAREICDYLTEVLDRAALVSD